MTEFDYIVLGAGPAGLQTAYYLDRRGANYVVLERTSGPGSFFHRYPRHRKLISINKVWTGFDDPEINLRWDWNALLSDPPQLFREYSKDYFPDADAMVRYLEDYAAQHALKIQYDTEVKQVRRDHEGFSLRTASGQEYRAARLIVATGVSKCRFPSDLPGAEFIESYAETSVDPEDFINQRVAVIGKGNSGFETAENLISTTAAIHLISPSPVKLAWKTHYVGHLRAVNNNLLDTYQLKSQNTIIDADIDRIERTEGGLRVFFTYTHAHGQQWSIDVDRIIACIGFGFDPSPFDEDTCRPAMVDDGRFPQLTTSWASTNVKDLYFAGVLMHGLDYRRAFSGFIHGFRYNIACLDRLLAARYDDRPLDWTPVPETAEDLVKHMLHRVMNASSLFQQPGFLADVYMRHPDGIRYYQDLPTDYVLESFSEPLILLTLEYGKLAPHEDPFNVERNPTDGRQSKFIHPVVRYYGPSSSADRPILHELHVPEDLENNWDKPNYVTPWRQAMKELLSAA